MNDYARASDDAVSRRRRTGSFARRRVIIDTDAKNEADDQFAIVHALLSPSFDLRGLIPAHFGDLKSPHSMEDSRAEIDLLLSLMGRTGEVTVADGATGPIPDEQTAADSPGPG